MRSFLEQDAIPLRGCARAHHLYPNKIAPAVVAAGVLPNGVSTTGQVRRAGGAAHQNKRGFYSVEPGRSAADSTTSYAPLGTTMAATNARVRKAARVPGV
jgi:hypothetical protein